MRHRRADTRRLIKQSTPLKAGSSALAAMFDVNKASRWTENGIWLLIKRQKPPFTHAAWDQTKTTKKVKDAQKKTNPITHLFIPLFRQELITNSSPTVVWMLCKITSLVKKKNGMAIYIICLGHLWNSLSLDMKNTVSLNLFKSKPTCSKLPNHLNHCSLV